jgi:hypothetical protein
MAHRSDFWRARVSAIRSKASARSDLDRVTAVAHPCAAVALLHRPDSGGEGERTHDGDGEDCRQSGDRVTVRRRASRRSCSGDGSAVLANRSWATPTTRPATTIVISSAWNKTTQWLALVTRRRPPTGCHSHEVPNSVEQDGRRFTLVGYGERGGRVRSLPAAGG